MRFDLKRSLKNGSFDVLQPDGNLLYTSDAVDPHVFKKTEYHIYRHDNRQVLAIIKGEDITIDGETMKSKEYFDKKGLLDCMRSFYIMAKGRRYEIKQSWTGKFTLRSPEGLELAKFSLEAWSFKRTGYIDVLVDEPANTDDSFMKVATPTELFDRFVIGLHVLFRIQDRNNLAAVAAGAS